MIKTSDTVFQKNIPLTLFESFVCERELETEQNCNILTPTLMAIRVVSFSLCRVAQPEAWGPSFTGCWFSLPNLISKSSGLQTNWLPVFTELYNSSTHNFLWKSQIAFIQPIHGHGYNILIDRMHLLFTKVHFLFWQPGRVVGQYTTGQTTIPYSKKKKKK